MNQKIKSKCFLLNTILIVLAITIVISGCEDNSAGNTNYINDWDAIKIDYIGAPDNSSWAGTPFRFSLNAFVSGLNSSDFDESNIVIIPIGAYKIADSDNSIEESVFAYWEVLKVGEDYFADATVTDADDVEYYNGDPNWMGRKVKLTAIVMYISGSTTAPYAGP